MLILLFSLLFNSTLFAQPVSDFKPVHPPIHLPTKLNPPIVLKPEYRHLKYVAVGRLENGLYDCAALIKADLSLGRMAENNLEKLNILISDIKIHGENFNPELFKELDLANPIWYGTDIDALVQYIMMEVAKDNMSDLRDLLDSMKKNNESKKAARDSIAQLKAKLGRCQMMPIQCPPKIYTEMSRNLALKQSQLDSISESSEMDNIRLQALLDERQKALEMLSNILKKISETTQTIIGNMK